MNWVEIQDRWEHFIPLVDTFWSALSVQEIKECNGDRKLLAAILQSRLGVGPEEAEQQICEFEKDVRLPGAVK